jgi:DNA-binding response OmpR family regulator
MKREWSKKKGTSVPLNMCRKIDDPFATKLLTTVRGVGYRLQPLERG